MMSPETIERVQDLLSGHRVLLTGKWIAVCASESGGNYTIVSHEHAITCDCPARLDWCVHTLAAAVLWRERDEKQRADDALTREVFG